MKYDHMVKKNGIYYAAGEEVPENEKVLEMQEMTVGKNSPLFSEKPKEKFYNKTEIQRMSVDSLRILAKEIGIDNPEQISGSELKKRIINHFEL